MLDHKESSNVNFTLWLSSPANATLGTWSCDIVTIVEAPVFADVVDQNADIVLPDNGTPIDSFSEWNMSLEAELSGANNATYNWSFAGATDATGISSTTSYNPTFTWATFTGSRRRHP